MIILGIETSCDETAVAVVKMAPSSAKATDGKGIQILSNVTSSSASLQEKYGGILPEQAAREQVKIIIPVIEQAINDSRLMINDLDAVAVTYGPGLIGSLLVGVETAKTLAKVWGKPLIPVNHLLGHFYPNWIIERSKIKNQRSKIPSFPAIGLLVSGGHTDLVLFKDHQNYEYLGGTRDDAAGECFDKCARLLGYSYPGGPKIAKLASQGQALQIELPRPMIDSRDFDFSFSGLKTAFANLLKTDIPTHRYTDLAASLEQAIVDVLVTKTVQAVRKYKVNQIIMAGGVAANQQLVRNLKFKIKKLKLNTKLSVPPPKLCTDNGVMIAARAFFDSPIKNPLDLQANPNLSLENR